MSGDATVLGEPLLVKRLAGPIVIDGQLDEGAWQSAAAAGPLVAPGEGQVVRLENPVPAANGEVVVTRLRTGVRD